MTWLVHLAGISFLWLISGAGNALLSRPLGTDNRTEWRLILSGPIGIAMEIYRRRRNRLVN